MRELAEKSGVSERFLVSIEAGKGNVSVVRLAEVARALGTSASALLDESEGGAPAPTGMLTRSLVLVGLRGAGKSSIGAQAAARLGVPFV